MNEERPNFTVKIVCLANSRKISGRCIAGKEIDVDGKAGRWIRPISLRSSHEISEEERRYSNGETARLLDIIEIPCTQPVLKGYQIENMLIDDRFYWQHKGRIDWQSLKSMLDKPSPLWTNSFSTRYYGQNNRIPENLIDPQEGSLRLIALDQIVLSAGPKAPAFGNMKPVVRASFDFAGDHYCLDVTDPAVEATCLRAGSGEYVWDSALACISLGELWDGYAYKLVTSIITERMVIGHD